MNAVRVRDLHKRYGEIAAVAGVSFQIARGEVFGLLGPNGAGKTSTLECLLGLRRPDAGEIEVDGVDALHHPARTRRRLGAVLQTTSLHERITPREALRLFAALHRASRARVGALLEEFGLAARADAAFGTLSGGQRQRLALALAHVHAPSVLVLDEPTAGLDPAARRDLHARVAQRRADGCAVLLSTHDMAEAQRLCDRLAIIDRGCIVAMGTPDELIAQSRAPASLRLRAVPRPAASMFASVPGVIAWTEADDAVVIHTADAPSTLAALTRLIASEGSTIRDLHVVAPTLEDAFLQLTGRPLVSPDEVTA